MSERVVVTAEDVVRVAELANLELTPEEMPRMARESMTPTSAHSSRVQGSRPLGFTAPRREQDRRSTWSPMPVRSTPEDHERERDSGEGDDV